MNLDHHEIRSAGLPELVTRLKRHGVSLPAIDAWQALVDALPTGRLPQAPEPSGLLNKPVEELVDIAAQIARQRILKRNDRDDEAGGLAAVRRILDNDLKQALRDQANDVVAVLRRPFDEAANGIRRAKELGVKPNDTMETLFTSEEAVRNAFLAARSHAKILDEIMTTRQLLSTVALVPPVPLSRHGVPITAHNEIPERGTGVDWGLVVLQRGAPVALDPPEDKRPRARWLKVAEHLALIDPEQYPSDFELIEIVEPGLASRLQHEANRRVAEGLSA